MSNRMGKVYVVLRYLTAIIKYFANLGDCRYTPVATNKPYNKVGILLDRGMGDYILFAYYLDKMYEYFCQKTEVVIIANTYNIEFLKLFNRNLIDSAMILKSNEEETVDNKKIEDYRGEFDLIIMPTNVIMPRQFKILRRLSPQDIIAMNGRMLRTGYTVLDFAVIKYIKNYNISEKFYPDMHREFLKEITGMDYGIKFKKPEITDFTCGDYFVVNLTSSKSNSERVISSEQFIRITQSISKYFGLKAVLLGELEVGEEGIFQDNIDLKYINRRNMQETINLCSNARFIITPNTGIMHLGISLSKTVFVIDRGNFECLFDNYPQNILGKKLFFVRKFNSCIKCPYSKFWCDFTRRFLHRKLKCVKMLTDAYICDFIINKLEEVDD